MDISAVGVIAKLLSSSKGAGEESRWKTCSLHLLVRRRLRVCISYLKELSEGGQEMIVQRKKLLTFNDAAEDL